MKPRETGEIVRLAFIPTERDWIVQFRAQDPHRTDVTIGPVSLDQSVLAQADVVIFDVLAPAHLLEWVHRQDKIGIQLAQSGDPMLPEAYFYLEDTMDPAVVIDRIALAHENRQQQRRAVAFVGAVGGCGLSEMVVTMGCHFMRDGLPTLLIDAGTTPGDLGLRLGLPPVQETSGAYLQRIDDTNPFWLRTVFAQELESPDIGHGLPLGTVRRVVVDMGTRPLPGVIERMDDLVIVTRPTPGGMRRSMALAQAYPGAIIAINGHIPPQAQPALNMLTQNFPGQVHKMPAVADVIDLAWYGLPIADHGWQQAVEKLLPPLPSLIREAA